FVRRALLEKTPCPAVHVFGVFAYDDEIDVIRPLVAERRFDAGEELHGPEVDVLIELKAKLQQQAFFKNARLNVGMSDRAEVNGVVLAQFVDGPVRQDFARLQVSVSAVVQMGELVL